MRINKFVALASELSRRKADEAITAGRVMVNGAKASPGADVDPNDAVTLDGRPITPAVKTTIMLNKPAGYVVSRDGQGSRTIYELLPPEYQHLQPVGRLDKDSSGLLLLTNDGELAQELTHPSHQKLKVYEVTLDKPLSDEDKRKIENGIELEDGLSKLTVIPTEVEGPRGKSKRDLSTPLRSAQDDSSPVYEIRMHEGRNRQIRRTFAAVGYHVVALHRAKFGKYELGSLASGVYAAV